MIINNENLRNLFTGYKTSYRMAFTAAVSYRDKVAMTVPSSTSEEVYGWLGQFPQMRKWYGDRQIKNLSAHGFTIKNEKFESTVSVKRDDLADDRYGIYNPLISEMGRTAKCHPDTIIFALLSDGFETKCFDGQNFFDKDHAQPDGNGNETSVSNMQDGNGPSWFLLDTSREIKPIIWQEREDYEFQFLNSDNSDHVFMRDQYLYGIRARANAGFGLWQLAYGSKADLTSDNFAAARAAMMDFRGDENQLLGVSPTILVVPPALEAKARALVYSDQIEGTSNIWKGTVELIVSPYLK
ncbi:hypothetical protein HBA92_12510 [Ochrobactrum sp. MR28]|nr:hypothetical protein [Ochrobactrum sp. MR28]MBX8816695.1 hypothetical protein [Ochrobactrum sp. MR31]